MREKRRDDMSNKSNPSSATTYLSTPVMTHLVEALSLAHLLGCFSQATTRDLVTFPVASRQLGTHDETDDSDGTLQSAWPLRNLLVRSKTTAQGSG
jgi:hypothetical protein